MAEKTMTNRQFARGVLSAGSALILAVVLTSLLAIVGVLFVMIARVDKMATSAISENRELHLAVETVIAKIREELVLDVPGVVAGQEYHDYPGQEDKWLASLEPNDNGMWRHVSDIYNQLGSYAWNMPVGIIPEYQGPTEVNDSNGFTGSLYPADADGDGVADSMWVRIDGITSSKGKPIYAAIRIVDNCGMINVNTAFKFDPRDPNVTVFDIDGSSQLQINLAELSRRGANGTLAVAADKLQAWRCGTEPSDLGLYEQNVIWRYNSPAGAYTPFDIGDELELRYRFLVNHEDIRTRIERLWTWSFNSPTELNTPIRTGGAKNITDWFYRAQHEVPGPSDIYSYRHIGTTYNMDRIINPVGPSLNNGKMVNVNRSFITSADKDLLYSAIYAGIKDANVLVPDPIASSMAAQIAVNLIDYRDNDSDVTTFDPQPPGGTIYYGFERPCIYISELAYNFMPSGSPNEPNYTSFAIELYKPYPEDNVPGPNEPNEWQLVIEGYSSPVDVNWQPSKERFYFHVIKWEDGGAKFGGLPFVSSRQLESKSTGTIVFDGGKLIELQRRVAQTGEYITVDLCQVPPWLVPDPNTEETLSFQRDVNKHKCIRRLWDNLGSRKTVQTLGYMNSYPTGPDPNPGKIQAHPYLDPLIYGNRGFKNVGEVGMVFWKNVYDDAIVRGNIEDNLRINLANPDFQQIFNYLTVFDPSSDGINNDGDLVFIDPNWVPIVDEIDRSEWKIPGRININTAPWFVMDQLPWVIPFPNCGLTKEIVAYRDTTGGFRSIGELMRIDKMDWHKTYDTDDLAWFPDLTPSDDAKDDFEERDVIFARISNLVTVRSDVFSAYILVRIGADGPQKRAIAILDRSNVYSAGGGVRVVALHPVPDPR